MPSTAISLRHFRMLVKMNTHLSPTLFARLMKLSDASRVDLLEYFGSTELEGASIEALIDEIESKAKPEIASQLS